MDPEVNYRKWSKKYLQYQRILYKNVQYHMYFEEVNRSCQLFVLNVISDGNLNTTETKQYNTIEYYEIFQTEDN